MGMTNAEMIGAGGEILDGLGIRDTARKTDVHTTSNMAAGDFMDRKKVERLVDLTVSQSAWLPSLSVMTRTQAQGEIPKLNVNGIVVQGVEENEGATPSSKGSVSVVEYATKKYQGTQYLTLESLRESRASGEPDFEAKLLGAFTKQVGNNIALAAMQGDTSLPATTPRNKLLRQRDGILKLARASANRNTTSYGSPYASGLWPAMLGTMPQEYRDDPDLRFMISSMLDMAHTEEIAGFISGGSVAADRAKLERQRFMPRGVPQLIIPQIPTDGGFAVLSGSQAAAGTVSLVSGNPKVIVSNTFGGFSTSHVGRLVKVTCTATGGYEVRPVLSDGSNLYVQCLGTLGQSTASTTSSDYTVDIADTTSAILTNPKNIYVVLTTGMRSYRKFEQEFERWRIDLYFEMAFGLFNPDAFVLQDGIVNPSYSFGS